MSFVYSYQNLLRVIVIHLLVQTKPQQLVDRAAPPPVYLIKMKNFRLIPLLHTRTQRTYLLPFSPQ